MFINLTIDLADDRKEKVMVTRDAKETKIKVISTYTREILISYRQSVFDMADLDSFSTFYSFYFH